MPRRPECAWYQKAAETLVRQNISFRQVILDMNIVLTAAEADAIYRSAGFQKILRAERHKFNTEIANDPGRTKTSLIGLAYQLIQKLIEQGDIDKALQGIEKLAKIEGWDKSGEVNIFAGVTAKDIELERARLLGEAKAQKELMN